MPQFDVSTFPGQIFWILVHFAVLYFVMARLVLPRMAAVFEQRQQRVDQDLEQARKLSNELDYIEANARQSISKARQDAQAQIDRINADIAAHIAAEQQQLEARLASKTEEVMGALQAAEAKAHAELAASIPPLASAVCQQVAQVQPDDNTTSARQRMA